MKRIVDFCAMAANHNLYTGDKLVIDWTEHVKDRKADDVVVFVIDKSFPITNGFDTEMHHIVYIDEPTEEELKSHWDWYTGVTPRQNYTAVEWLALKVQSAQWKFADITDRNAIIKQALDMEYYQLEKAKRKASGDAIDDIFKYLNTK